VNIPPICERLEHVRDSRGLTLKEFHERLGGREFVSYSAVRNYELDRDPPVSYLLQVSRNFAIRLEWLLTGDGARTEAEQEGTDAASTGVLRLGRGMESRAAKVRALVSREVAEALGVNPPPSGASAPEWLPGAVVLWSRLRTALQIAPRTRLPRSKVRTPDLHQQERHWEELARVTGQAIAAPLNALGIDLSAARDTDLSNYVLAVCAALAPIVQRSPELSEEK
jgi:transcriptional regulator with XRE-family HTH domain